MYLLSKQKLTHLTFCVVAGVFCLFTGFAVAQNYGWESLGSVGVEWDLDGAATSNQNSGSIIIGGQNLSSTLRLDVSGQVGGTNYCNENGASCLQVSGVRQWVYDAADNDLYLRDTNTQVGIGRTSATQALHVQNSILANSFLYSSDINLKENITPLSGLDIVNKLQGVRFDWKDTGESEVGVIAQQVEAVLPELVITDEETGNKLVQYSNLVAPLIQAVNEQTKQLELIEQDINQIKLDRK